MTLPLSGPLSFLDIQTEFGGTPPISLSEYYRGGSFVSNNSANIPTNGSIGFNNFYGATKQFAFAISTNYSTPQSLKTLAIAAGWNQIDSLQATINTNVIISSNTTASPALSIVGTFPNGVSLINNGFIVGMGGLGGAPDNVGKPGGTALSVSTIATITNNGTIAGGGGGGGAGVTWGWNGRNRSCAGSAGASGLTQTPGTANLYGYPSSNPSAGLNALGLYTLGGASVVWGYGGRASSPGGIGGNWGLPGDAGGTVDGNYSKTGYAGGAAGNSILGFNGVTMLNVGTLAGPTASADIYYNGTLTIISNKTSLNLSSYATSVGWNGTQALNVTIETGVQIGATTTATAALIVSGSFPAGVQLTNKGFIVGRGGNGGGNDQSGTSGGLALAVTSPITINNAIGTIAGGGGGGAGGTSAIATYTDSKTGGIYSIVIYGGGGGGGRSSDISPSSGGISGYRSGTGGNLTSAGVGGVAEPGTTPLVYDSKSGTYSGGDSATAGGNGGNWGVSGASTQRLGGPGASAINGNTNITWTSTGTRIGTIL